MTVLARRCPEDVPNTDSVRFLRIVLVNFLHECPSLVGFVCSSG